MEQYMHLFKKTGDEYDRYWASISEAKLDKKGKKTNEYIHASISCRLSDNAKEKFDENAVKTKKKVISTVNAKVTSSWLKPVNGKDQDFVILFVNDFEVVEQSEED